MERKIILNLAMSVDGYICDEEGGFDWIKGHDDSTLNTKKQFDFGVFADSLDVLVMGKRGYDDAPEGSLDAYDDKTIYVVTNSEKTPTKPNVKFIKGDVVSEILKLKQEPGKDIWIYGGAVVADLFIKADVIDEYIFGMIPCVLGRGRRLFLENNPMLELTLVDCTISDGIIISTYTRRK